MRICYLNQTLKHNSGAGNFYHSISAAIKLGMPDVATEVLASENVLYPNKFKLLLALPVIRKIIRNSDVIHALDGWPYGVVAALASIGLKKPLIITAVGTGAIKPFHSPIKRRIISWAYRRADQVVAVSHNTKKELLSFIPDLKVEVIPHGVDVTKFQTVHAGYQIEAEKLKPYVLGVGSLKPRKGFDYSIEAFAKIANKFPELKYVIVGGGPEYESLKFKVESLELKGRILFLSNLHSDYVNALYQNAELFILLSQDDQKDLEGFGLVFLEAAACGLPVIGTKGTGAEDAILDGKNGFLVPTKDSDGAAEMMEVILTDKKLKTNFSNQSVVFANEMTWKKAAESYLAIYQEVKTRLR